MILSILLILVAAVLVLALIIARKPGEFTIARSATIAAPASILFEQVNDFRNWNSWSPWARMDPNAKNTFEGTPGTVGSKFHWDGNKQVGAGNMTLITSTPGRLVGIQLEFLKPFQATNQVEFTFTPTDEGTVVKWSMSGHAGFVQKAVGLLMNCDKMIGAQYEQGLENLRASVPSEVTAGL